MNRILSNHYPEINLAWLRSYDSYYDSYNNNAEKVVMADSAKVTKVAAPLVNGISDHAPVVSQSDPVVTLTVPGDVDQGAGIFYRFSDNNYPDDNWHPYSGPITLPVKDGEARMIYNLYTYAIHDGIRSNTENYTICLDANNQLQYTYPGILSMDITDRIPLEKDKEYRFEAPSFETQAFRNWTVADGFDDPSGKLSGLDLNARANTFQVNTLGNYSIKANYYDKSNAVTLTMGAVTSGQELPQTAILNTATPLNGKPVEKNVSVPVAWTDLGGGKYLATINLPVDPANELCYIGQESGWIFKSYDTILKSDVNAAENNGEGVAVTKAGSARGQINADGSAIISQQFDITGYTSPAAMRTVTLKAWDVNTNDAVNYAGGTDDTITYQYVKNTSVSIPVPPVTSENCIGIKEAAGINAGDVKIENGALCLTVPDENVELTLNYKPVVNMISLVVSGEPQAGQAMPSYLGTVATIENAWAITDGVKGTWDPNAAEAAYNTAYTLHLTMNTSELKGVMVDDDSTEWSDMSSGTTVPLAGSFDLAENLAIRAVDENGNALAASCTVVSKGENTLAVDVAFPATKMNAVESLTDLSPMIYSGSVDFTEYAGPPTIPAVMTDGTIEELNVSWTPVSEEGGITTMTGTITSDNYEWKEDIVNVPQILVIVSDPDAQTSAPTANLMLNGAKTAAGRNGEIVRLEDRFSVRLALSASSGATIYYTTDGTDPTTESSMYTEPFEVGWGDSSDTSHDQKEVFVKAIAVEAGKQESSVTAFEYTLEKDPTSPVENVCPKDETCPMTIFTDTDKNAWYHDGIHWAISKGIMYGTSKTTFEPMTATNRAMIVTMLWRMEGSPVVNYQMSFKDVPDDKWYTEAIRWAASTGIVNGFDEETFGTNDSVTREQIAAILYRSAQAKGQGFHDGWAFPLNFDDADQVSGWADEAMHWMVMTGVINGVSEKELSPGSNAVRAQVATMLMRFEKSI